jgi:hypothetical protein
MTALPHPPKVNQNAIQRLTGRDDQIVTISPLPRPPTPRATPRCCWSHSRISGADLNAGFGGPLHYFPVVRDRF